MGIRRSSHRNLSIRHPIPLRLDILAQSLCKCLCHIHDAPNPHKHTRCSCIPTYSVDGHALAVVQLEQEDNGG